MSDDNNSFTARVRAPTLLKFPGESPVLHASVQWWESTQTKLAVAQLLQSANGKSPDAALRIQDTPLSEIPSLPIGDRDFHRREELRIAVPKKNGDARRLPRRRRVARARRVARHAYHRMAPPSLAAPPTPCATGGVERQTPPGRTPHGRGCGMAGAWSPPEGAVREGLRAALQGVHAPRLKPS